MSDSSRPWVKHYQPGVPAEIDLPNESLVEMVGRSVARFGPRPAIEFFGRRISYTELGDQIDRVALGLKRLGVQAGHRVAIVLPNCPQAVVAFHAVLRLGAVAVQHNPLYTPRELRKMFEDHGAAVAIVWTKAVEKVQQLPPDIAPRTIISVDVIRAMPKLNQLALRLPIGTLKASRAALYGKVERTTPWEQLLRNPPVSSDQARPRPDDLAAIQYTSGTTGEPKGAMLTHANLYANCLQGAAWMHGAKDGEEISYAILPLFHTFGLTLFLTFGLYKGMNLVLFPKFDVDLVLGAVRRSPPSVFCAVPPIYEKTAREAKRRGIDLTTVKYAISGAMTLPESTEQLWEGATSGLLVEGYGLTESSPVALGNPFAPSRRTGTIGVPFPSTDMKVVDADDWQRVVEQGKPGELLLKGPQIFQGYWNKPEETAKTLTPDGWLRTGDIVTQDEDGFTTIVDRKKEIIITGGFNVMPSEVEQTLNRHPDIAESAVVGLPTESGNDEVVAVLVMRDGKEPDAVALRAYCKQSLAAYKAPRRFVKVEELPKSMLGKVLRRQVAQQLMK